MMTTINNTEALNKFHKWLNDGRAMKKKLGLCSAYSQFNHVKSHDYNLNNGIFTYNHAMYDISIDLKNAEFKIIDFDPMLVAYFMYNNHYFELWFSNYN